VRGLCGSIGIPGTGSSVEKPAELGWLKRGGAIIGGAIFESIEPSVNFGQTANDDNRQAAKPDQGSLEQVVDRRTEDDISARPIAFRINRSGQAIAMFERFRQ